MSPLSAYLLGLATLPLALATSLAAAMAGYALGAWLDRHGIAVRAVTTRPDVGPGDYILRRDIWWERSWGPFFAGGWHHLALYQEASLPALRRDGWRRADLDGLTTPELDAGRWRIHRWIGFGRANGPYLLVLLARDLGPHDSTTHDHGASNGHGAAGGAAGESPEDKHWLEPVLDHAAESK